MHNVGVHLVTRKRPRRGPTRAVVWAGGGQTDLGVVVAAAVAVVLCAVGIVAAIELRGLPRAFAGGLAVLAGAYAAVLIIPMLVIVGGVNLVKSMAAGRPSMGQRTSWVIAAALIGAMFGTDAYGVGLPGLLTGPILLAVAFVAAQMLPNLSPRARHRVLALSAVAALSAVLLGLTIFVE